MWVKCKKDYNIGVCVRNGREHASWEGTKFEHDKRIFHRGRWYNIMKLWTYSVEIEGDRPIGGGYVSWSDFFRHFVPIFNTGVKPNES